MNISTMQLFLGFLFAALIAVVSYYVGFLSLSGAIAACVLGTIVFGLGGFSWAVILVGFFFSSSLLSKVFKRQKAQMQEKFSKGNRRDVWQVWANGGVAGIFVIFHVFFPDQTWPWLAFCGALAAVNADTWATELGVLSKKKPINLVTGKQVEPGTSGGISLFGTTYSVLAAAFIALLAIIFWPKYIPDGTFPHLIFVFMGITSAGLLASLVDSLLGATIQAMYYCPQCKKETEKTPVHLCGHETRFERGWKWLNNDWVNTICGLIGGFVMVMIAII